MSSNYEVEKMQYYILFIIITGCLIYYLHKNAKVKADKVLRQLKSNWGKSREERYDPVDVDLIKADADFHLKDDKDAIDDITWNDLDMNRVFHQINNTQSSMGEVHLYQILRLPIRNENELLERDRIIEFFQTKETTRIKYQMKFNEIGKNYSTSFYEYLKNCQATNVYNVLPHILIPILLGFSILVIFLNPNVGSILTFIFAVTDIYTYYKSKYRLESGISQIRMIGKMLDAAYKLSYEQDEELKQYLDTFHKIRPFYKKYKRDIAYISLGVQPGISDADILLDYLRIATHIDLIKYAGLVKRIKQQEYLFKVAYETLGYLDSMIAIASFREQLNFYCRPEINQNIKQFLNAKNIYHPLIHEPILNSLETEKSILITGSNASGKSTFLKTIGINAILAQTIYTVCAETYQSSYYKVMSSMAIRDDIVKQESYYMAEIKSLKRIMDASNEQNTILCIIDEVLRGTNTIERIAASSIILEQIACMNTLCFTATHDIELTYLLEKLYQNYHFQEKIIEDDILFDYKLYSDRSESRNAISLLKLIGYSENLINEARSRVDYFTKHGSWVK
jgi:DNA mismatch repair ATPase MutS